MTATPPPPPPMRPNEVQEKAPPVAWLIPVAGVLALVGGVLPWFRPELTASGRSAQAEDSVHAWDDGKIGIVGPVLLILVGIGVAALLIGKSVSRFERGSSGPVVGAARGALVAGAVGIVTSVIAFFLLKSQYEFETEQGTKDWDTFLDLVKRVDPSAELSRGPQIGFWLTAGAAVLALVGGALMLMMRKKPEPAAPGYGQPPSGFGPPPQQSGAGYPAPQSGAGYPAPQSGAGYPAPQGGPVPPPPGYQQPQGNQPPPSFQKPPSN